MNNILKDNRKVKVCSENQQESKQELSKQFKK